jgi:hypothetical protein
LAASVDRIASAFDASVTFQIVEDRPPGRSRRWSRPRAVPAGWGAEVVRWSSVVIIGGGYAGISVVGALDEDADVTLVERRDAFVHNVAALRALVQRDMLIDRYADLPHIQP